MCTLKSYKFKTFENEYKYIFKYPPPQSYNLKERSSAQNTSKITKINSELQTTNIKTGNIYLNSISSDSLEDIDEIHFIKTFNGITSEHCVPIVRGNDGIMEIRNRLDFHYLDYSDWCRLEYNNTELKCNRKFHATKLISDSSTTITHVTGCNSISDLTISTYCETDGTICEIYDNISPEDCICNIKQSSTLNKRIIGVITSTDPVRFATHGDILLKYIPDSTLELGDILVPGENGFGTKATAETLTFCRNYNIPVAKITAFINNDTIACILL